MTKLDDRQVDGVRIGRNPPSTRAHAKRLTLSATEEEILAWLEDPDVDAGLDCDEAAPG